MASAFPTSKRSACDRCRSQKLRCPPREPPTDACSRCIRLGAWCATSYSRPSAATGATGATAASRVAKSSSQGVLGPPPHLRPKASESGSGSGPPRTAATTAMATTTTTTTTSPLTAPGSASVSASVPEVTSQPIHPVPVPAAGTTTHDPLPFSVGDDHLDIFARPIGSIVLPDGSIFGDRSMSHHDEAYHDLDSFSSLLSPPPGLTTGSSNNTDTDRTEAVQQSNDSLMMDTDEEQHPAATPRPHSHFLKCDPRLSSLSLDLSRRLQQCLTMSGAGGPAGSAGPGPGHSTTLDSTSLDTPPTGDGDIMSGRDGLLGSKLFGDALGDLSEFLVILQSYYSEGSSSSSSSTTAIPNANTGNPTPMPTPQPRSRHRHKPKPRPIGIVVILNLLSAYLQIVAIYDRLFHSLCRQLRGGSVAELQITTFSSSSSAHQQSQQQHQQSHHQQGTTSTLQTKLIIHAILHQFETIERHLGLPAALRVTTDDDRTNEFGGGGGSGGLFGDNERARELLDAVSRDDTCSWKGQVGVASELDHDHEYGYGCGLLRAPSSLREAIRGVQMALDM